MAGNNTNIVHVEVVENLCISLQAKLGELSIETAEQHEAKSEAQDYLNLYQKKQVKALRNAFQDN